jgi:hypothetical protein
VPQLQVAKTNNNKNSQKVDNILKMDSHARKFEVLPVTKMLPCATICRIEHPKNHVLGTPWLPLEFHTHFIASTKKLSTPCSWKNTRAFEVFQ